MPSVVHGPWAVFCNGCGDVVQDRLASYPVAAIARDAHKAVPHDAAKAVCMTLHVKDGPRAQAARRAIAEVEHAAMDATRSVAP